MPQKSIRQALNEALAQEMRRDPDGRRDRRGRRRGRRHRGPARRLWRRARRHQGALRRIRRGAGDRHADHRVGDHGCGRRRGGDRAAAGRRTDVLRLLRRLLRPDLQPGGQVPLHVRRQGQDAAGDPHDDRRRAQRRRPAFAEPLSHLHLGAGLEMRGAVERLRRQGPVDPGDPRRRPGDLLRAQADVRSARRGAGRALCDPVRRGQHRARRRRCDRGRTRRAWCITPPRRPRRWLAKGSSAN